MNAQSTPGKRRARGLQCALRIAALLTLAVPQTASARVEACIAEGTPVEKVVARVIAAAEGGPLAANVDDRWTRTATDGSGITRGEPITLTWSIVDDGTAISAALSGESNDDSDLVAYLDSHYGSPATWLGHIQTALDGWSNGPGITFVYESQDDGVELGTSRGVLGIRGDIRIGGHDIDGNTGTVAYAYFPEDGDVVIDTNDSYNTSATRFRNVVAHEVGHAIGLGHVCPTDRTKLMEPIITTLFSGPQFDDLLGAHRNYGDEAEENDDVSEAADLGLAINTVTDVTGLALDGTDDDDWYEVPAGSLTEVSLQLDPSGSPYNFDTIGNGESCNDASPSLIDPRDTQDLAVAIYDFDGTTLLASSDASGIGGSESIDDVRLSTFGGYIEVTNGGGVNDAQGYEIEITLVPEPSARAMQWAALLTLLGLALAARRQREARP